MSALSDLVEYLEAMAEIARLKAAKAALEAAGPFIQEATRLQEAANEIKKVQDKEKLE